MTVKPPPTTAPCTTAMRSGSSKAGTSVARNVMSALSLNAVRMVDAKKSGTASSRLSTGAIHQPCKPPWITRPPRKKPTSSGVRSEISL